MYAVFTAPLGSNTLAKAGTNLIITFFRRNFDLRRCDPGIDKACEKNYFSDCE